MLKFFTGKYKIKKKIQSEIPFIRNSGTWHLKTFITMQKIQCKIPNHLYTYSVYVHMCM